MATKIDAAVIATGAGIAVQLWLHAPIDRRRFWPGTSGTFFPADGAAHRIAAVLAAATRPIRAAPCTLDAGAVSAVTGRRASLLGAGIVTDAAGTSRPGTRSSSSTPPMRRSSARGLVAYSAADLPALRRALDATSCPLTSGGRLCTGTIWSCCERAQGRRAGIGVLRHGCPPMRRCAEATELRPSRSATLYRILQLRSEVFVVEQECVVSRCRRAGSRAARHFSSGLPSNGPGHRRNSSCAMGQSRAPRGSAGSPRRSSARSGGPGRPADACVRSSCPTTAGRLTDRARRPVPSGAGWYARFGFARGRPRRSLRTASITRADAPRRTLIGVSIQNDSRALPLEAITRDHPASEDGGARRGRAGQGIAAALTWRR